MEKRKNLSLQISSTPTWVFDLPEIKSWLDASGSGTGKILWLSATTGFGKSVLAAYVTDELTHRFPSAAIAFFCKDNDFLGEPYNVMRTSSNVEFSHCSCTTQEGVGTAR